MLEVNLSAKLRDSNSSIWYRLDWNVSRNIKARPGQAENTFGLSEIRFIFLKLEVVTVSNPKLDYSKYRQGWKKQAKVLWTH